METGGLGGKGGESESSPLEGKMSSVRAASPLRIAMKWRIASLRALSERASSFDGTNVRCPRVFSEKTDMNSSERTMRLHGLKRPLKTLLWITSLGKRTLSLGVPWRSGVKAASLSLLCSLPRLTFMPAGR